MKKLTFIALCTWALIASCTENILDVTHSDEYSSAISFDITGVNDEANITRGSDHPHGPYDVNIHPETMGVFGFHDDRTNNDNAIFSNITVSQPSWTYSPLKYWSNYSEAKYFDFFAYMPQGDGSLSHSGNTTSLRFSVTLPSPIVYDSKSGLICHTPVHKTRLGEKIAFKMDQILTGYSIQFKLGNKMDNIRDFRIKEVKFCGQQLPVKGFVGRSYTFNGSDWSASDVTWTISDVGGTIEDEIEIEGTELQINSGGTYKWGKDFYMIPVAMTSEPSLIVKYDVIVENTNVISRKDVESKIVFNKNNFGETVLQRGETGKVNPIIINIVPDYLYVLADSDQLQGYLLVNEKSE